MERIESNKFYQEYKELTDGITIRNHIRGVFYKATLRWDEDDYPNIIIESTKYDDDSDLQFWSVNIDLDILVDMVRESRQGELFQSRIDKFCDEVPDDIMEALHLL